MLAPVKNPGAKSGAKGRQFNPIVFAVASLAAAVILVSLVAIPQYLSKQARWESLRAHVGEIARLAASVVDGDLHRQLLDPANYSDELYKRALAPLVRFHSADPDIFYVYTMVERDGVAYFVLDTAASRDLKTNRKLEASGYMERFDVRPEYNDDWLGQLAAGKTYVNPSFEEDDYGTFLTGEAPIYDSEGRYSGFAGVDFDLEYYFAQEARFRDIAIGSLIAALVLALLIGYGAERYYSTLQSRMQALYESSTRDALTGLRNRLGAIDAVKTLLARRAKSYAALLIDIDGLKIINDTRGHATGDAVIALIAEAIRGSIREGDECARIGGDEFFVFAADCDQTEAMAMARGILAKLAKPSIPLTGANASVSIGVVVLDGVDAEFSRMYRDADHALYQARYEGKSRIGLFVPSVEDTMESPAPAFTG
ncbi:GGDEF domain-containing protein [Methyloceanibacter sp.]|uniref:GGDEF domain-containing protein n=1 Tax=Methyloceanibacter sp. TaxID=1965321 RepID=UPI002D372C76|nr:GGDEF domain-containing protein [Methyloceanibacter sp.]HZP10750.1 GGDEF domain-containing protein [Methyloceanibacter sp.]